MSRPVDWGEVFGIDDPTPGDPFEVRRVASSWGTLAGDAEYAATKVRQLMTDDAVDGWIGEAGAAFRSQSTDLPDQLGKCADSYRLASEALSWWAGQLETHQGDADSALVKGRSAKADLEAAQAHLALTQGSVDTATAAPALVPNLHPPSREQVQAAQQRLRAAQAAQAQASAAVTAAQSRLDAAKRLALDAGSLREQDGRTAASRVHEASDAGIAPRHWWQKAEDWISDHWDTIIEVARVAVAVLSVVALILGGPLAWAVFGLSVLLLADAINKWREGKASLWDVLLCAIGCIPGARGLTSTSELSAAYRAGGLLGAGGHVLGTAKSAVTGIAQGIRGLTILLRTRSLAVGEAGSVSLARSVGPGSLPARLAEIFEQSQVTRAGRAFYETGDEMFEDAHEVSPIPGRYVVDMHGDPTAVFHGAQRLSAKDLADMLRADPNWSGEPIHLVSCETGQGTSPFAQHLADELGVEVHAPDQLAWNGDFGEAISATPSLVDIESRMPLDAMSPPDGTFIRFVPTSDPEVP